MRIKASGFYEGRRREVTWTDGALAGDAGAIAVLEVRSQDQGAQYFGPPTGGGVNGLALDSPAGFVALCRGLLLGVRFSGDLEEGSAGEAPEGTIS